MISSYELQIPRLQQICYTHVSKITFSSTSDDRPSWRTKLCSSASLVLQQSILARLFAKICSCSWHTYSGNDHYAFNPMINELKPASIQIVTLFLVLAESSLVSVECVALLVRLAEPVTPPTVSVVTIPVWQSRSNTGHVVTVNTVV